MSSGTRLFIGNLPENTNENELRSAFSGYGEITSVDLKNKSGSTEEQKRFAFVTISTSNQDIETCIKHFSVEDFKGSRLYVTRARESFLERLQRERQEAQRREEEKEKHEELPKKNPVMKLSDRLNPRKRKSDVTQSDTNTSKFNTAHKQKHAKSEFHHIDMDKETLPEGEKKKQDSEKKRLESMKKKRQEFKEKQMIIKTGLIGVDKTPNKKVIFSDYEDETPTANGHVEKLQNQDKNMLFDDNDDSGDDVNFEIKKQFEGEKGQKVLDLQSRYKSDKRFVLDERFIDGDQSETEEQKEEAEVEAIELEQDDEKMKQLNILQDVLGVAIKTKRSDQDNKKTKTKMGMLRFDPLQPEHAKFLVPVEEKKQENKKSKKKNKDNKEEVETKVVPDVVEHKVEVSKEQFYKVSEILKEAIAQPTSFSLRSLFTKNEDEVNVRQEQEMDYIPLEKSKKQKVKNPLDPGEKNPFVYDSSESEAEEDKEEKIEPAPAQPEVKAVWKENLFFSNDDTRLKEALMFFNKPNTTEVHKERRELKSLMKKRIYNKQRKNQMFQKKIGGRKKTMKKSYNKMKTK